MRREISRVLQPHEPTAEDFPGMGSVAELAELRAAHVVVCVLASLLERVADRKLKAAAVTELAAEGALHALKRVRRLRDAVNGVEIERISHRDLLPHRILWALGVAAPSPHVAVLRARTGKQRREFHSSSGLQPNPPGS